MDSIKTVGMVRDT